MSVAWRTSPEEESIEYKDVIRSRRPKDTRMPLPDSWWKRRAGCEALTAMGNCGQQVDVIGGRNAKGKLDRCYWHAKVRAGLAEPLRGSMFNANGTHDKMPPPQQTRKRAQHD